MGERTEYELPGAQGPAYFICGIWRRNGRPYDDLAALLDAAETHYREQTATAAEGLAAVRRIRVEAGLGVLEWTQPCDGVWSAVAAGGLFKYGINETEDGRFLAAVVVGPEDRRMCVVGRLSDAKTVCDQWFGGWLEQAGLEVRR